MDLQYSTSATTDIAKKTSKTFGKTAVGPFVLLLRPKQWVKNLFLFIPSFFAGNLFDFYKIQELVIGVIAFSLVASGIYILNDYQDRHVDKLHPVKKYRPI